MSKEIYVSLCSSTQRRYRFSTPADKLRPTRMGGRRTFLASLFLIAAISLLTVYPLPFFNGASIAGPGTSKLSTSTITVTTGGTDTSAISLVPGGGFKLSDAEHTASYDITTDNFNGYKVKLVASDDDKKLVNTADPNYAISSIESSTLSTAFPTNKWGIKPNKYYDGTSVITNTDTLLPDPGTTGQILDITNVANPTTPNTYTIAVGAKVDGSVVSGTYTRTNTITVTPNEIFYTINYNKNTDDTVTNMPGAQSSSTTLTKITLDSATPAREHFEFAGWCDGTTGVNGGEATCSGTVYQPGADFGIDQTTENITTLYAMWNGEEYTQAVNIRYQNADGTYSNYQTIDARPVRYGDTYSWSTDEIENFDSTTYVNSGVPEYTVTDSNVHFVDIPRNTKIVTLTAGAGVTAVSVTGTGVMEGNKVYYGGTVEISATLKNDYEFVDWTGDTTYTNNPQEITNVTTDLSLTANALPTTSLQEVTSLSQCTTTPMDVYDERDNQIYVIQRLLDGQCWMMDNLALDPVATPLSNLQGKTNAPDEALSALKNGGGTLPYATNAVSEWTSADQTSFTAPLVISTYKNEDAIHRYGTVSQHKTGVFYNYCAATAGTYCYPGTNEYDGIGDATYDICPAGWRLPVGGDDGDFYNIHIMAAQNTTDTAVTLGADIVGVIDPNVERTLYNAEQDTGGTRYAVSNAKSGSNGTGIYGALIETYKTHSAIFGDLSGTLTNFGSNANPTSRDYGMTVRCILRPKSTITFHTVDAASIEFNGETYTDGQTVEVYPGTYSLRGNYGSRQAFSSWDATAGTISNANYVDYNLNTYEVVGDATVTLTGKPVTTAIQNLSSSSCTSSPTPVYDNRDDQVYYIKRLDDGLCWMMDNLNLGAIDLTNDLTSINTNLSTTIPASTFNSYRKTRATQTYTSAEYMPLTKTSSSTRDDVDVTSGIKLGTLYNFCAASAGTACTDTYRTDTASDICPAGWRLPKGGYTDSTNEYYNLYTNPTYETYDKMRAPVSENGASFTIAGYFRKGSPVSQGEYGFYWSTVRDSDTLVRVLSFANATVNAAGRQARNEGRSMRCVLDGAPHMQNISSDTLNELVPNAGDSITLKDARDGQEYTVTKLPDGNVWMTQNLRFTGTTLNPDDSNVSASTTIDWLDLSTTPSDTAAKYHDSGDTTRGVWYNYAGASAKQITSNGTIETAESICPAGWRLPTMDEFTAIFSYVTEFNPSTGGIWYNSSNTRQTEGFWWSSTANTSSYRYGMYYNGTSLARSANSSGRSIGEYVRCIYSKTMQEFSATDADNMTTNQTRTLKDDRDGQLYTVTKLGDSNVWMTRNIAIGCDGSGANYGSNIINTVFMTDKSNVSSNNFSLSSANNFSQGSNYDDARIACDSTKGAWYNYAAASAGTITGASNTDEAQASICPKGWRLPTYAETLGILGYKANYLPVTGGYYSAAGALTSTGYGYQWASTAFDATKRDLIRYDGTNLGHSDYYKTERDLGIYVRCIKDMPNITSATYMQDITSSMVASTRVGTVMILKDSRDNETYKVAKLSDGKLWMLDNLNLDLSNTAVLSGMSATNTNASATTLNYLKNGGGTTSDRWAVQGAAFWGYTPLSYSQPLANTSGHCSTSITYPCSYNGNYTKDTVEPNSAGIGVGSHKIGVYYNYCAATAGSYCYGSGNSSAGSPSGAATEDVCPAGWKLPTGGASGEFQALCTAVKGSNCDTTETMNPTDSSSMQYKLSTTYSGNFGGSYFDATTRQGTYGFYWASTYYSAERMHGLWVSQSNNGVSPQSDLARWGANSIRCVSK